MLLVHCPMQLESWHRTQHRPRGKPEIKRANSAQVVIRKLQEKCKLFYGTKFRSTCFIHACKAKFKAE
jgi:hypothetical protein